MRVSTKSAGMEAEVSSVPAACPAAESRDGARRTAGRPDAGPCPRGSRFSSEPEAISPKPDGS
jgi:hypothetical protein